MLLSRHEFQMHKLLIVTLVALFLWCREQSGSNCKILLHVLICRTMFFILTCDSTNCLIIKNLTKGGRITVKKHIGTALAVNIVTGCLFTVQQYTGDITQISYSGSRCPAMKYNNPFPDDDNSKHHVVQHTLC